MQVGNIIFAATCWLCALIFAAIALWAFKRKDPMHFWSGTRIRSEEILDIPSYNRANALMWSTYAVSMTVTGILALFNINIAAILLVIICLPGLFVLILVYNRIYNKYKNTALTYSSYSSKSKTPKAVILVIISISAIIILALVLLFSSGEKDPAINITNDSIEIRAMYGVDIDFSEIVEISLIEENMYSIGIGRRTNGYGGFGGTLKGNFESDTLGETLVFVHSRSLPTIKIERIGQKNIYISFRDSGKTRRLFNELLKVFGT